jgi:pimeloyl-ACP methyl ester carboxylesterase
VLGLERPILLGESSGGFVALQVARDHPDLAGGLILASTVAWWTSTGAGTRSNVAVANLPRQRRLTSGATPPLPERTRRVPASARRA